MSVLAENQVKRVRSRAFQDLEIIFSEAEALLLDFERYLGYSAKEHSSEHLRNVLKIADFFVQLKNLDYYERSLAQKKRDSKG